MKAAVIVPTNRPDRIAKFIEAWRGQFLQSNIRLLVIEDFPERQSNFPAWIEHYCHEDIDAMGDVGQCIPRYSDAVRDFGFWKAAQDKSLDMIVSLDDDVTPIEGVDLLAEHWKALETPRHLRWWPTANIRTRGYPYSTEGMVKPMLNHGLWQGTPDLDACEQLQGNNLTWYPPTNNDLVPPGMYFPMCTMNLAFRPSVAPFLFELPLPDGMKQFGDIWVGVIFKRIADLKGWAVSSGDPAVHHDRASQPLSNLRHQFLGYGINEELWRVVDKCGVPAADPVTVYGAISVALENRFTILIKTAEAMRCWAGLWEQPVAEPDPKDGLPFPGIDLAEIDRIASHQRHRAYMNNPMRQKGLCP